MDTRLSAAMQEFATRLIDLNESGAKFSKKVELVEKTLNRLQRMPSFRDGMSALKGIGTQLLKFEPILKRSLAMNEGPLRTLSTDQLKASFKMGIGIDALTDEVLALKEEGITKLSGSTISLAARMKATGQDTQSLIKFVGRNSTALMLNQKESQDLAVRISQFAGVYQSRQDEMLNLANSITGSFRTQSQLGAGAQLTEAFTNLGSVLGGRGTGLVQQMSEFLSNASLSQLTLLGIADNFQERIANETDPERQKNLAIEMAKAAANQINALKGGLGKGATDTKILEQLLKPFGGQSALVFPEIIKALEDAKEPMESLSESLTTFASLGEVFAQPMKLFAAAIGQLMSIPFFGNTLKVVASIAGAIAPILAAAKIMKIVAILQNTAAVTQRLSAILGMKSALITAAATAPISGLFAVFLTIAAALGLGAGIWGIMSEDIKQINNKTPDPQDKNKVNAGLTGQIFSQLVNIVASTNTNSVQREQMALQRELVRLAREQNDRNNPNNSLVTRPPVRKV